MLNPSTKEKLLQLADRRQEVNVLLSDPETIANQNRFRELSIELSEIEPVVEKFHSHQELEAELDEARIMLEDDDSAIRDMAREEIPGLESRMETCESELQLLLLPKDPNDSRNIFLEIRAGTGGDEAALFSGDLFRMYNSYAESKRWKVEVMSSSEGEHGGYKEIITRIEGQGAYSRLKFESGAHRVQRVPETESQGRIHTSACTVAILPEADELEDIDINKADLRVDTFRASGSGGQHVNKTDSAIRLTHLPSGIVVECQDERSQHKNKAKAMALLQAKLNSAQQDSAAQEQADERRNLVGSGDRSERIRTYNFPLGRVTDHRVNLTLYKLDEIMDGTLDEVVGTLVNEHQADQLAALSNE